MEADYESNLGESSPHVLSSTCVFCHGILSFDNNDTNDLDSIIVCGDCKFLLLEDLEITSPDMYPRRLPLSRRRDNSSESIESIFSQRFSQLINLARQNHHPAAFEHDYQSLDGDGAIRSVQHTSSRTTPSGSRRWRRLFSDTESEGFDSMYGESESNVSFRRYSAYGGDSDASLDDYGPLNGGSDLESDTDIDPMNAGLYRWNSEEDDSEWEEADMEIINTLESLRAGDRVSGTHVRNNWRGRFLSPEVEAIFPVGIHERISQARNYVGESGDYIDDGGFENLLERLAETESSIRGAPPASVSFINSMPCVTINEEGPDSMACAICKDSFIVGTVVNRLPCFHLFHPSCILPWLSSRNTCPVCRHEVPTDDKDYEARKRNEARVRDVNYDIAVDGPSQFHHNREQSEVVNADSVGNDDGGRDVGRNRWFFLAAPIVGIVGITLMLCFGNHSQDRKGWRGRVPQRRENSTRRWWSFF